MKSLAEQGKRERREGRTAREELVFLRPVNHDADITDIASGREGKHIVQELCESRGDHPGLSVLTSLMVSVDVKQY